MITLKVELGHRSYPILIGSGLLQDQGVIDEYVAGRDVLIVTNENLESVYLEPVRELVSSARVEVLILPDGEATKTLVSTSTRIKASYALGSAGKSGHESKSLCGGYIR